MTHVSPFYRHRFSYGDSRDVVYLPEEMSLGTSPFPSPLGITPTCFFCMLLLWLLRSGKLAEMYENNVQQNENPSYKFPNDYELNIRLKQKKKKKSGWGG